jgi:hypothetical protein
VQGRPGLDEGTFRGELGVAVVRFPEDADGELKWRWWKRRKFEEDVFFFR